MKAAIIGASEEALHTIKKAQELGLEVLAFDGNPEAAGLKAADKGFVADISKEAETIAAIKKEAPDFILTVPIGRYLTTVGAVNDALGLPGIDKKAAALCTDKFLFHEQLAEQGLRNCHCYPAEDFDFQKELVYPAVLKPRFGSGSRGIYLTNSRKELKDCLALTGGEDYLIEECIPGEEYGVDGAVTAEGFQMILLRRKINTPPPARQAVGYLSVIPSEENEICSGIFSYMKKVTETLAIKDSLLHADIIWNEKGPFAIEVSARPSGHNLHNLFTPLASGIDMAEEYIKYRMNRKYSFLPRETKKMMIHYFDMEGMVAEIPTKEELEAKLRQSFRAYCCNLKRGEALSPVTTGHSVMGRGYFVLEGKPEEKLLWQAEQVKAAFMCETMLQHLRT